MSEIQDIIVITNKEYNEVLGIYEQICSHGVNIITGEHVTLPAVKIDSLGAVYDQELGEYVI